MTDMPTLERRKRFGPRCSLMDVHGALSHLVSAAMTACEGLHRDIRVEWKDGTYLTLVVECRAKHAQVVALKLQHGLLDDYNDYRFTMVSLPKGHDDTAWVEVWASPDLQHDAEVLERIPPETRRAA